MKNYLIIIVVAVIVGAVAFYGGIKYGQSSNPQANGQPGFGQNGGNGMFRRNGSGQNGGFAGGEIINQDSGSITVKLRSESSKIVLISSSTVITKSTDGSLSDLTLGKQVTVGGSTNSDGSITAQTVQIRPTSTNGQTNQ
jgi:hypothetical protein